MIYSVWNQPDRRFDYYESDDRDPSANVEPPGHLRARTLGSTPDQAAWPLPPGARRVGHGAWARGRVASIASRPLGAFETLSSPLAKTALLVAAGYVAWRGLIKGR